MAGIAHVSDLVRVAVLGWTLIGAALGLLGRRMAVERLPLGVEGALDGGALGGVLGGATESLAAGAGRVRPYEHG